MAKKTSSIPVNYFSDEHDLGVFIEKIPFKGLPMLNEWEQPERHDRHSFFFLEKGNVTMEIDFRKHKIGPSSIIYMHPDQVHRILSFKNVTVICLGINNENLHPGYLKLMEEIMPAMPLELKKKQWPIFAETISLCIKLSERKKDKLYHSLLKDSCNALIALVLSQYLEQPGAANKHSRFEIITKAFKEALERDYSKVKRPAAYAQKLNISTPYLNECVKHTTGNSASHHIQQRVILEAKRLLYHSDKSVKEIAAELGYDDYPYFSRLFSKVTGMTALSFRNKNLD